MDDVRSRSCYELSKETVLLLLGVTETCSNKAVKGSRRFSRRSQVRDGTVAVKGHEEFLSFQTNAQSLQSYYSRN
jgi:hypothetical protein